MEPIIHIQDKITDYILDTLPAGEKQAVTRHIAGCLQCRRAVEQEREIGRLVHHTLSAVTRPNHERLSTLMPAIPQRPSILALLIPKLNLPRHWAFQYQWALACLFLVAMMGAFLFGNDGRYQNLAQPTDNELTTLTSLNVPGTTNAISTMEAGDLLNIPIQHNTQINFTEGSSTEQSLPLAAPLPVAPQITPAPEATYFQ
ncbi:MAG: zf-HC2 domain-containing protein [Candidatus Promineifilaceae bacterium]